MKLKMEGIEVEIEGGTAELVNGKILFVPRSESFVKERKASKTNIPTPIRRFKHPHRKNSDKRWTPTEDEQLLELRKHKSYTKIAKTLGRTPVSITNRLFFLRKSQPIPKSTGTSISKPNEWQRWKIADMVRLGELLEEGKTFREIGKEMGRTTNAIRLRAQRFITEKIK